MVVVVILLAGGPAVLAQGGPTLRDVIRAADLSPNGSLIALGGEQGVWLYDTRDFAAEPRLLTGHTRPVEHVVFSPDGRLLASSAASPEDTIYLWDAVTGEQLAALYPSDPDTPQEDHPTALDFSDDCLVSGHQSGYIWFWNVDPDSTKIGTPISIFRANSAVVDLDVTLRLVTLHGARDLVFWQADGAIEHSQPSTLTGIAALPFIHNGTRGSYEAMLARMDGLAALAEAIHQHGGTAAALCPAPETAAFAIDFVVGGADGSLSRFNLASRTAAGSWQASDTAIAAVTYDRSCQRLLTLDEAGGVALWDVPTQTAIAFQAAG